MQEDKRKKKKAVHLSMASPKHIHNWYKKFSKDNNMREVSNISLTSHHENKSVGNNYEWCVCYDNPPNGVFFSWGHAGICYEWAIEIFKKKSVCHFWRNEVYLVLKIELRTVFDEFVLVKAATFAKDQNVIFESEYSIESINSDGQEESKIDIDEENKNEEEK